MLLRLQKRGARIILKRKTREVSSEQLFKELRWLPLIERWTFHKIMSSSFPLDKGFLSILFNEIVLLSHNSDVQILILMGT